MGTNEAKQIEYTETLERGRAVPGAAPIVRKIAPTKPEPSAPATPATPDPVTPAKPEPAKPEPAAPAVKPTATPSDDCGDPPCLKADPSRSDGAGSGH